MTAATTIGPPATVEISGRTRIIAHLGNPTTTFTAPLIYNPYFASIGENVVVVPLGCALDDFEDLAAALLRTTNAVGALVTMPFKRRAAAMADVLGRAAGACGAANALRRDAEGRLVAEMFDGVGFVGAMRRRGVEPKGLSTLVVGAGGVGSAITASLAEAGAGSIAVYDVDRSAAQTVAARVGEAFGADVAVIDAPDPIGRAVVVNATPLGMNPDDPLPLDPARLRDDALVGDVVLGAQKTPFLRAAEARGLRVQTGVEMLFSQISAYLRFFDLPPADEDVLRRVARIAY